VEISEQQQDGILILTVVGQIDSTTGLQLGDRLDSAISQGYRLLALDLNAVPYISSIGLRVLTVAHKALRAPQRRGAMCLVGLTRTVACAFSISGFDQLFSIYDTMPEAIAALSLSDETDSS
jgi:anti-sigma B factor antagonist